MGKIEALWTKRAHRGPMDAHERVRLRAGEGIEDDANRGRRKRQVTVIEKEVFERITDDLGDADPSMRRANVLVSGVGLANSRGRVLRLGDVRLRIHGETRPCERMDAQAPGLTAALSTPWNGGVYGVVLDDGEIAVGDEAALEDEGEAAAEATAPARAEAAAGDEFALEVARVAAEGGAAPKVAKVAAGDDAPKAAEVVAGDESVPER